MNSRRPKPFRRPWHKPFRRAFRPALRPGFRVRWRAPDDLAAGLTAFRRAIRAHRRLARLAPHHYDVAVVDRDRLEHQERLRWKQVWQPALEKAYGPPTPAEREAELHADWLASQPPKLHPHTQRAVDRYLAEWHLWMEAGRQAWDRHRARRPHGRMSWGRMADLLELAVDFGRLATGLDSKHPPFEPQNDDAAWADLRRAYGHSDEPAEGSPRAETVPSVQAADAPPPVASPPPAGSGPGQTEAPASSPSSDVPTPDTSATNQLTGFEEISRHPAVPVAPSRPRCDAYSRLARQLRRLHG